MNAPDVEVVIPVHDARRPVGRAIDSLDRATLGDRLAVTVVAHNIPAAEIADRLTEAQRSGVTFLTCDDGRNTPAGPRTLALGQSTARYVSFLDSDDWLEPGALASWLGRADREKERHGIDPIAVIAPERNADGTPVRNPPIRLLRSRLDPRRDRLPYRSAVRGLCATEAIRERGIAFGTREGNGSDLAFSLGMWYSGLPVVFAGRAPAYVLGDDGAGRVTRAPRPLAAELDACTELLSGHWFAALALPDRRLVAAKFVRMHLVPGLVARADADPDGLDAIAADAAAFLALSASAAPGYERVLALLHRRFLDVLTATTPDLARLADLVSAWHSFRPFYVALTRSPLDLLRFDAPPRWVAAMLLLPLRMRRAARRPAG